MDKDFILKDKNYANLLLIFGWCFLISTIFLSILASFLLIFDDISVIFAANPVIFVAIPVILCFKSDTNNMSHIFSDFGSFGFHVFAKGTTDFNLF